MLPETQPARKLYRQILTDSIPESRLLVCRKMVNIVTRRNYACQWDQLRKEA